MIGVASQIANTPRFSEFLTHIEKDGQSNENQNFKKKGNWNLCTVENGIRASTDYSMKWKL